MEIVNISVVLQLMIESEEGSETQMQRRKKETPAWNSEALPTLEPEFMVFGRATLILFVPDQALSVKLSSCPHANLSQSWDLHYRDMRSPRVNVPLTTSRVAVIDVDINSGNVLQLVLDTLHHLLLATTEVLFLCFRSACLFDLIVVLWDPLRLRRMCILTLLLILLQCLL